MKVKVIVDGREYEVEVEELPGNKFKVSFEGKSYEVKAEGLGIALPSVPETGVSAPSSAPVSAPVSTPAPSSVPVQASPNTVTAPMPGKILKVLVSEGQEVKTGQGLVVLEAMKMENEIPAPKDGVVKKIYVKEGDTVNTGDPLVELG
ncbi:acetyl-CoA carboxylase biotin carboxyl carrier protein subunit [Thermococcus sp.]|uniref:acetyl-CoA carboxylase biotin carboxyl carrier protein subunit n=1 Tax=Thermococcus sp. TaxID=35749 RepID=UPI00261C1EA8|nr:acetyl-CoA carboxylase biotin carboxyl carrier protein subunit [Thermococcus sp.]